MVGDSNPIAIDALADEGMIQSATAVSLGLIVTELVINAIKYAFPGGRSGARIMVTYETNGPDWKLAVSDNGVGQAFPTKTGTDTGLGTTIVKALAKQLGAGVDYSDTGPGLTIAVTRASFTSRMPKAA
jgi:chemotaxis protein methyltransferase CheR